MFQMLILSNHWNICIWCKFTYSSIIPYMSYAAFANPLQPEGECFTRKPYEKSDTVSELPCSVSKKSASVALHYILLHYTLGTALIGLSLQRPVWVSWGCLLICINSVFSSRPREADCESHSPHQKALTVSAKWMLNQRAVTSTDCHSGFLTQGAGSHFTELSPCRGDHRLRICSFPSKKFLAAEVWIQSQL